MERREAPAFLATGTRQDGRLMRRSALHSLGLCPREAKGKTAYPGPQKIGAVERWLRLFDNESERGARRCCARLFPLPSRGG